MSMEAPGKVAEQRVPWIGCNTPENELMSGDAQDQCLAELQEGLHSVDEPGGRLLQMGVAEGVHGPFVQDNRKFDQEVGKLPGQHRDRWSGRALGRRGGPAPGLAHSRNQRSGGKIPAESTIYVKLLNENALRLRAGSAPAGEPGQLRLPSHPCPPYFPSLHCPPPPRLGVPWPTRP